MSEHDLRKECKNWQDRMEQFRNDMENPKDGVIQKIYRCINNKAKDKVGMKIFYLACIVIIGSYGYTNIVGSVHNELATKKEVQKVESDLKEDIKEVKENVKEIKRDLKDAKKEILDAIKSK
jgi:flagellar motility protein MotE (MotC chaperone)